MLAREDVEVKERAERALRDGRPDEALPLFGVLLRKVTIFEGGVYERWLEGALAAYEALGRKRESGYLLLFLRRFAEAERCFSPESAPHEAAICAANQGRPREASRILAAAGRTALAAMALETAADWTGARQLWEALLREDRLKASPYETALVQFNLGQTLRRMGDPQAARRALARTQRMLEELADDFETRGERERAFDCYAILMRLGRDGGSFENVAEGYLNAIRILATDEQKFTALQYYEDFLEYAASTGEWHAAAMLARDAADYSAKAGLAYERHYRQRAVSLWNEAARASVKGGSPPEIAENALVAAIDAASALGDLPIVGRLYATLADLPLAPVKRERYAALAARYRAGGESPPGGPSFPEHLRRRDVYQEVWRQDLVEWELGGDPRAVLVQLIVERLDYAPSARQALRALLLVTDPRFSPDDPIGGAELSLALARVQAYEILRPLEELSRHVSPRVRAATMTAAAQVFHRRSFGIVRRGLDDPDDVVRHEARRAVRAMHFRDGFEPLTRIFRDAQDEPTRLAALESIADIRTAEAGLFLVDLLRRESGALFDVAAKRLRTFPTADILPALRHHAAVETGDVRAVLQELLLAATPA